MQLRRPYLHPLILMYIDEIHVATDCDKIKLVIINFEFSKVKIYDRSAKNAGDTASTESVMLEFIDKNSFNDDDLFFLVQATSPLTQTKDFDEALVKMRDEKSDSLLTCTRTKSFIWNDNGTALNYVYQNRPRRQDFDGLLMENGAFYINNIRNIKQNKNRLSGKISIYEMEEYAAVEIDEDDDWHIAEKLMYKYVLNNRTQKKLDHKKTKPNPLPWNTCGKKVRNRGKASTLWKRVSTPPNREAKKSSDL